MSPEQLIENVFKEMEEQDRPVVALDKEGPTGQSPEQAEEPEAFANAYPELDQQKPEVHQMDSVSQLKPTSTLITGMTGRTYISQLQRQLNEEKEARQKLEGELSELKKISSEISSQLG